MRPGIAVAGASLLLAACATSDASPPPDSAAATPPAGTARVSATVTPTSGMPSAEPASEPAASRPPQPSAAIEPATIPPGAAASVVVAELRVRAEPGLTGTIVARLSRGDEVFVTDVPRAEADGLTWAHVQAEWLGDGDGSGELGYVALADASGPFLEAVDPTCPRAAPSVDTIAAMTPWARLMCFGSDPLALMAFDHPENYGFGGLCNCVATPEWLLHPFAFRVLSPPPDASRPWVFARFAPGVERQWPGEPGELLRVTGHFDDPAAADCEFRTPDPALDTDAAPWVEDKAISVLRCREQFVLTEVEVVGDE